jgi:predicted ATPase
LSPQRQKQKTQEALVAWLLAEAAQQPVLAVWEDLHWADPSTLELLALLLNHVPTARLLLVLTARPEFHPSWVLRSYMTPLTLTRLTRPQREEMVLRVTGGKPLPAEVLAQIVAKTDGIPLFVEELVKDILEAGLVQEDNGRYRLTGPLPHLAIPVTLQDALMARLDRLAVGKEVAQFGAVLGREFSYALLQAVVPLDEATVQQALAQLVEAELLYQRGKPPQATYVFKHALIQEAAYQSLLKSTRQQYHQRIAQVLVEQFPETAQTQPEVLAQHYTHAGLTAQAVVFGQRAGQRAMQHSAPREAISHLTQALEVLQTLPDTPERNRQELDVQSALAPAFMAAKGYAAPEVGQTYARVQALCQQLGETARLFAVLRGLSTFHMARGEYQHARELGEQLLHLAQRQPDPTRLLGAHQMLGMSVFWLGEAGAAQAHFETALALYDPAQHRALAARSGQDPRVVCLTHLACTRWLRGFPDQARQRCQEAVAWARALAYPHSLAVALTFAGFVHQLRREHDAVHEWATSVMTLTTDQDLPFWWLGSTILRGWALAAQGQGVEGMMQMRQGLAAWEATGAKLLRPYYLALLAEVYGKGGQVGEGLRLLDEALSTAYATGERNHEAELYRLQGELLLSQGGPDISRAEHALHRALATARRQQVKSWELRAAMSLARLWQQQGKRAEAHELLAPIYGWFTEGFDTADLQEAKALLEAVA